jgi:hypothetical protein
MTTPWAIDGSTLPGESGWMLSRLLHDVHDGRIRLRAARSGGRSEVIQAAHEELVATLTVYVDELVARRLPVPYLLRDELRIYERTLDSYTPSRPGGRW